MKLIITRHGETEENKQGIIQGHLQGTLSELGKEQARKLAERLKNEKIDLIFSSDLNRAKDTAEEIAKFHPEIPFELDERLRERNWGDLKGRKAKNTKFWESINWEKIKDDEKELKNLGIETLSEGKNRTLNLIKYLSENHKEKNILLVSHSEFIRIILSTLFDKDVEEFEKLKNTSLTIFEFNPETGEPELKLFNCTKHLD